ALEAASAGAWMRPFEAAEPRLALGVDLAAVERLALRLVAENLVGRIELGKLHRRLGVVLVGVGMQFLGQLAEGLLDFVLARRPRHPQNLVGVSHPVQLPNGARLAAHFPGSMWCWCCHTATRIGQGGAGRGPRAAMARRRDAAGSGAVEPAQGLYFPFTTLRAAGFALQPGLGAVVHVAGQEIAANDAVLGVGGGDRCDGAACARARIL